MASKKAVPTPDFWSPNNLAASATWGCLRSLSQFGESFEDAPNLRMDQLQFWNKTASVAMQRVLAKGMADQLDQMFRFVLGATYDDDITQADAVQALEAAFATADKTLLRLSYVAEDHYTF